MSPMDGGGASDAPSATLRPQFSQRLTLHLGVVVQPYRSRSAKAAAMSTGDVAEILEAKYGLYSAFWRVHQQDCAGDLEVSLGGAMESLMMGRAVDAWGSATQAINQRFRDFINSKEAERVGMLGVPTKAAQLGVNHRLKHPYRKSNPRRPSFRDTGLLVNSFRSWVD
jgi:hypothetical protein